LTTKTRIDAETETLIPTFGGVFVDAPDISAPVARSVERPRGDGLDTLIAGTLQAGGKAAGSATQQDAEAGLLIPIAFSMKDYGGDASFDLAPTLRAGNHDASHANGGQPPAIAFQARGSNLDLGQEVTGTLTQNCDRASGGAPCIAFDARQDCTSSTEVFGALGSSSPQAQAVCHTIGSREVAGAQTSSYGKQPDSSDSSLGPNLAICVTGDIAHTLKAEGFDASEDGTGRGQPIVAATLEASAGRSRGAGTQVSILANTGMAVRRLTPRECERLQSFTDDYTLIPYGRVIKMEKLERDWIKYLLRGGVMTLEQVCQAAADGPRYKALGNSWCVYKIRWLGCRIHFALTGEKLPANFTHEHEIVRVA
jgi:DNA (cytosine-5)-methyltransferase 1